MKSALYSSYYTRTPRLDDVLAQSNTILGDERPFQELKSFYTQYSIQDVDLPQPESGPSIRSGVHPLTGPIAPTSPALLEALARGPLMHWPPPPDVQWYMNRPRPFDQNILHEVVRPIIPLPFRT